MEKTFGPNSGIVAFLSLFSPNKHTPTQKVTNTTTLTRTRTLQTRTYPSSTLQQTLLHYNPWPLHFSSLTQFLILTPSHSLPRRPHLTSTLRLFSTPLTGNQDPPRWSHAPAQTPVATLSRLRCLFLSSVLRCSLRSELVRSSTKITTKR